MKYKIKLIVGFRRDQEHSIGADEAHKAYYLFLNPEMRGIFKNGLALVGSQIQEIVPDWQGTMGWNPTHVLDGNDWNEIRQAGADIHMNAYLSAAREIVSIGNAKDINVPLPELLQKKYPQLAPAAGERREGKTRAIGEMLKKKS